MLGRPLLALALDLRRRQLRAGSRGEGSGQGVRRVVKSSSAAGTYKRHLKLNDSAGLVSCQRESSCRTSFPYHPAARQTDKRTGERAAYRLLSGARPVPAESREESRVSLDYSSLVAGAREVVTARASQRRVSQSPVDSRRQRRQTAGSHELRFSHHFAGQRIPLYIFYNNSGPSHLPACWSTLYSVGARHTATYLTLAMAFALARRQSAETKFPSRAALC